jgi:hypothetical protein
MPSHSLKTGLMRELKGTSVQESFDNSRTRALYFKQALSIRQKIAAYLCNYARAAGGS